MVNVTGDDGMILSTLEEDLLTLIQKYGDGIYGLDILNLLNKADSKHKRRKIGVGRLYPTLKKMETQGQLKSFWEDKDSQSDSARRRYYQITSLGKKALSTTAEYHNIPRVPSIHHPQLAPNLI